MSDDDPEAVVRRKNPLGFVFGGGLTIAIVATVGVAEWRAEPQRQLAVATLERLRAGDPTASSAVREDLANALAGRPSNSGEGLEVARRAASFDPSWNTTVSWGERCVEVDAYAAAGRTRLYVAMAEDVNGWALTAITTHETDWGPCSSD